MIKGTEWTMVKVWHDEDEPTEYKIKVQYEYEWITNNDPYYQELHTHIEVIEWPDGITESTKKMINNQLPNVLDDILSGIGEEDYDRQSE